MIEMKQLQYFEACADQESFSKAANVLYTTQPNVSKTIRTLEDELGFSLFYRMNRGIRLTSKGQKIYEYAYRAVENVNQLAAYSKTENEVKLQISCVPGVWMSSCFVEFYKKYSDENACFQIITAELGEILHRCSCGQDEVGFVSVPEGELGSFLQIVRKSQLEFIELKRMKYKLLCNAQNSFCAEDKMQNQKICLVQYSEDEKKQEYFHADLKKQGITVRFRTSVITNSDYILEELLNQTDIMVIDCFEDKTDKNKIVSLYEEKEATAVLGYVKRKEVEPGIWAGKYIQFVKKDYSEML